MSVPLHLENSNSMTAWWWKEAVWLWLLTPSDWLTSARLDSLLNYDLFWRQQMWLKFSKQWPGRNMNWRSQIFYFCNHSIYQSFISWEQSWSFSSYHRVIPHSFKTKRRPRRKESRTDRTAEADLHVTLWWGCGAPIAETDISW